MKRLKEWNILIELVETKSKATLYKINLAPNHFFLEQNPNKDSKYGVAYKELKQKYPNLYIFWEIKDDEYTGKTLIGQIGDKEELDRVIEMLLKN